MAHARRFIVRFMTLFVVFMLGVAGGAAYWQRNAANHRTEQAMALALQANICRRDGRTESAKELAFRAMALDPSNVTPYFVLADVYFESGDLKRELSICKAAIAVIEKGAYGITDRSTLAGDAERLRQRIAEIEVKIDSGPN